MRPARWPREPAGSREALHFAGSDLALIHVAPPHPRFTPEARVPYFHASRSAGWLACEKRASSATTRAIIRRQCLECTRTWGPGDLRRDFMVDVSAPTRARVAALRAARTPPSQTEYSAAPGDACSQRRGSRWRRQVPHYLEAWTGRGAQRRRTARRTPRAIIRQPSGSGSAD